MYKTNIDISFDNILQAVNFFSSCFSVACARSPRSSRICRAINPRILDQLGVSVPDAKHRQVLHELFLNSLARSASMAKIRKIDLLSEQVAPAAGAAEAGTGIGEDGGVELQALLLAAMPAEIIFVDSAYSAGFNARAGR